MKKTCEVCGRNIGFFGGIIASKVREGYVCADCSGKVNEIVNLYGKTINNYTFEQMKIIADMIDADAKSEDDKFPLLFVKIMDIDDFYKDEINKFKQDIKTLKKEISDNDRASKQELKEYQDEYKEYCELAKRTGDYSYLKEDKERLESYANDMIEFYNLDTKMKNFYLRAAETNIESLEFLRNAFIFEYRMLDMIQEQDLFGFTGTTDNLLQADLSTVELLLKDYIVDSGNIDQNFAKTSYNNWRLAAIIFRLYHTYNLHKLEFDMENTVLGINTNNVLIDMNKKRLENLQNEADTDAGKIADITAELNKLQKKSAKESQEHRKIEEEYENNFQLYKEALAKFIHFDENGNFIDDIDQNKELQDFLAHMKSKDSEEETEEEQKEEISIKSDSYSLKLISYNTSPIGAIKVYKKLIGGDLKAATETIKSAPCILFDNLDKQTAISYMAEFKVECPDVKIVIEPN